MRSIDDTRWVWYPFVPFKEVYVARHFAVSTTGRRIVGRFDRGVELVEGLLALCREQRVAAGEVRALGRITNVELTQFDDRVRGYRAPRLIKVPLELVQLYGNVSSLGGELVLRAHATLLRDDFEIGGGLTVIAGQLVKAVAYSVEFVIEAFDDLALTRELDRDLGLPILSVGGASAGAAGAPKPTPPPPVAWGSGGLQPSPALGGVGDNDEPLQPPRRTPREPALDDDGDVGDKPLRLGDWIEHPRFGRCHVQRIDDDEERITVRLENQRLIVLGLEVLKLSFVTEDEGHQIFKAQARIQPIK